LPKPLF